MLTATVVQMQALDSRHEEMRSRTPCERLAVLTVECPWCRPLIPHVEQASQALATDVDAAIQAGPIENACPWSSRDTCE